MHTSAGTARRWAVASAWPSLSVVVHAQVFGYKLYICYIYIYIYTSGSPCIYKWIIAGYIQVVHPEGSSDGGIIIMSSSMLFMIINIIDTIIIIIIIIISSSSSSTSSIIRLYYY